uniref:Virulence factor Mce family protein n=1 Tax=Mycolicibacterium gilvum (strain PYR-GCK) TaxID=350054 RepID=A4T804_MYCGI|nr:virulence factor Mce family protein [Mycolicibacterium gilvum PYR-GCK]
MLTRFVRNQLIIFTIASIVGVAVMIFSYMQVPTLLGIGRLAVTLELPASGGLYRFSNVTYRGVQVGKVTEVNLTENGAEAILSLDTSPEIPADLRAEVRSVSAVGEQYVELLPQTDDGPFLEDGSRIPVSNTTIPQQVGPMLDQMSALVGSLPKDRIPDLLDETFKAFNGAGPEFGSLLDSATTLAADMNGISEQTRALIDDSGPLLESQAETTDAIRTWARSLNGISAQVVQNDPQVRALLQQGPGFAQEVSSLLNQVKPTLPILLANMSTVGQTLLTYNPALEQLLVLFPGIIAAQQSFGLPQNSPTGLPTGDFALTISDPNPCTVGFLPSSQWRAPEDETTIDTPDGLYCKLPQDSPMNVRGARNYPCLEHPGKRAPTVELCNDPRGFVPMAIRQHITGPYPFDPNLVAQGIPIDDRVSGDERIHAPVQGTPLPPGAQRAGTPPVSEPGTPPFPVGPPGPPAPGVAPAPSQPLFVPPAPPAVLPPGQGPLLPNQAVPAPPGGAVPAAPSAFGGNASGGPSVATAAYDPNTGQYLSPDGAMHQISNVTPGGTPKSWKDLLPM